MGPFLLGHRMSDLQIQGEVVVSSEKAEAAFDRVGDKAERMASDVAKSANEAGKAVDGIGGGAEKSAEKFTRAEARIRDSIKKSTQELQLLGKTASEKLEFKIADRGLDASKFAPYIAELKKAEDAQRVASGSLDKMGVSAKQTAAALRGVPAQFTDIITSLQGGQAPLTVFLQQGGQLKDMFGGAGAAARALGGYVVGLINPFTLAAAGAAALAVAYNQGSKEADAYRLAMVGTGNAAGTTAGQLKSYAQEISGVVGTQGKAAESLAAFVSTGRVSRDVLKEASQAAIAWERATGQAVGATAKQFADLGKDPLQAVLKLNEGTNFLTESVYRQIKSLEEQGKTADAAAVAQRAYADALTGRAGEIERNLGSIETAWNKVKDAAKGGWDAILNVGRAETNQDRLAATRKQIADLENRLAAGSGFSVTAGGAATGRPDAANNARLQAQLLGLQAQAAALEGVAFAAKTAAEAEAERAKQMQAAAAWDKEGAKYLTDKAKLERDLTAARNEGLAAGKSQAEIEKRLAQIRESYAKKGGSGGIAAENKDLRDQQRIYAELAGVSSTYYSELANYQKQRAAGVVTEEQYVQAVEKLISKQPFYTALVKEESDALKARVKAYEDEVKAQQKLLEQRQSAASQVEDSLRRAVEEEQAHALAAATGMTLAEALAQIALARAEDNYQKALGAEADAETLLALQREIEARKGLIEVMQQRGTREQFAESNREMTREWQRTVDQYGDVFRQGFADMLNNGKDGWKSFTRSLVTTFKTTVADQIYKMFAQPFVVNLVGNMMGLVGGGGIGGQAVQAAGGGAGIMGMASNASSAYSLLTGGATGAAIASSLGSAAISLGNLIGSSAVTSFGAGMAGATLAPGLMGPTTIGATGAMGAGAGLGSTLAAIPGWGWALAGIGALFGGDIVSGLFGRKHEQRNLQGTFGGDTGFEGRWEDYYKGGLLRRSKSVYTPLDEETRSGLGGQFVAMRAATAEMAETLGLGTSAISNFTTSVNIKLKGLSAEEAQKKIQEEFDKIAESLAGTALGTDRFTRSGESSVQTLTRLSGSITAVNSVLEHLNGTFFAASLAGADMASQLVDLFGDAGAFTNATAGYFQNFYSAGEQRQASRTQLERQLATVGVSMPDIDASNARAQWRALANAQDLTTESGRKTWAMLIQLSDAFAGLTQSIDEVIDKAFADLRAVTDRQLDGLQQQRRAVQESLSLITGIFDLVRSNARELYGEVADTASMQAAQGMEFVRNALTVARSTGVLPEQDALNEAIQAARSDISQAGYASQFDADFARLSLAGQLSELGDISGRQKTFEEQQLAALDAQSKALQDQLSYWEEQIAILRGTAVATWDIGEAVRNLAAAIGSAKAPAIPAQPEAIPMPKPVLVEEPAPVQQTYPKDDLTARQILNVSGYGAFGPDYYGSLASWLKKRGISTDQAAYVLGMTRAELLERFASVGIPAFAVGTNYVPRDMLAQIHEGEAIVPKAFNPWAGGGGMQMNTARLEALVEKLTEENQRQAGEIVRLNLRVAKVLERWDGDGMPTVREEAKA